MKKLFSKLTMLGFIQVFCISVFSQSVSVTKTIYAPGEKIIVNYSGFPGNSRDWISISAPGSADGNYLAWQYTGGNRSGTMTFDGLAYGDYEIRGYYNNENTVRARVSFRVGNIDQNVTAKTSSASYKPGEKITVQYSGLPGNSQDWVSLSKAGSQDGDYVAWQYTNGIQSGTMDFAGLAEGNYEVRTYFNGENKVRSRYPFTVSKTGTTGTTGKICRKELSIFYAGMNSFGLSWGRLGSDAFVPAMIADVQTTLGNVIAGIQAIPCIDFDVNKIRNFSSRLPGLTRVQAVNEIDQLIKELQGAIRRARISCDNGVNLESLFITGIHLGAAQAIANTFVCRAIPADWQSNLRNHLTTAGNGIAGFSACIPGVNPSLVNTVPVGAANAYEPFSIIVGIHMQVLWSVSLSECCCFCS